ncbi:MULTISPECIES: FixH family protein [Rhodopseudomonas]|uniref:FixH n=1 Tax=Rhodopseudomonas palustris TaxID=1076 RepID=A0A0D7F8A2_RHOPL|nr:MULTISPECIES: FixH family protein [Rhodopseudomonas]KIZ47947.1 FixH [Rhodopseudomonas palustris]MDF3811156.1 FixH family protein [Rhodopseudomonas sp. BAL398]WOK16773.1 FixH family protein [Rhodopseudomonas sp. BAL398]
MSSQASSPRPLTGRVVLAVLVGFFGLVIGVNVLMATLAIETLPGTEVDSPYAASLAYEGEIAAAHAQAERAWNIAAKVERQADGSALLRVEARDKNGAPLHGLKFVGRLERPADKRADREVALAEVDTGIYRGNTSGVSAGQWDLVLEGDQAGTRMFLSKNRLMLN